jgi:hypothetical protein
LRGFANVRNDVAAFDRIAADQLGHRRGAGGQVVDEMTQTAVVLAAFKKCDAPAIGMVIGDARALCKASEAERGIGGVVAIEREELTHG